MTEPLKPNWLELPSLVICEILQEVGNESLEDLASCRLVCKTWNDEIKRNKIWEKKLVKLKKSWDEGEPKYGKAIVTFEQEVSPYRAAYGNTFVAHSLNFLDIFHGENFEREWKLRIDEDGRIDKLSVTKDVIAFTITSPRDWSAPNRKQRLEVCNIRTHSKLTSLDDFKGDFLVDGSQIIVYKAKPREYDESGVLTELKVIDVYNQGASFTYNPKQFKFNWFLSFENSYIMSFYNSNYISPLNLNNKVTILEIKNQDRKVLRKHVIFHGLMSDYPILGGFFTEPNFVILQQNHITVYNVSGERVRFVRLFGEFNRHPKWYHAHGRLIVTSKISYPCDVVHVWKIEDLVSKDGKPRNFEYEMEMQDFECKSYEIGDETHLNLIKPVMDRESIRIHICYPHASKIKWVTMKF